VCGNIIGNLLAKSVEMESAAEADGIRVNTVHPGEIEM
jgi:NAD(P)-dependent dehydrogenase (short-subunit alcohol dehydrogenase family)